MFAGSWRHTKAHEMPLLHIPSFDVQVFLSQHVAEILLGSKRDKDCSTVIGSKANMKSGNNKHVKHSLFLPTILAAPKGAVQKLVYVLEVLAGEIPCLVTDG